MAGPSVKIPVDWLDSFQAEDLGSEAVCLLLTALGYSARQTSDGVVPRRVLRKLWPVEDLDACVDQLQHAGELELRDGDDLYLPSWRLFILEADEVDKIREQNRIRDERRRRHARNDHTMCISCDFLKRNSRGAHANSRVSHADPIRPDPTRPEGEGRSRGRTSSSAGAPDEVAKTGTGSPSPHSFSSPSYDPRAANPTTTEPCSSCGEAYRHRAHHGHDFDDDDTNHCTVCGFGERHAYHHYRHDPTVVLLRGDRART